MPHRQLGLEKSIGRVDRPKWHADHLTTAGPTKYEFRLSGTTVAMKQAMQRLPVPMACIPLFYSMERRKSQRQKVRLAVGIHLHIQVPE